MVNLGCVVLSRPSKEGGSPTPPTDIYSRSFVRTGVLASLISVVVWNTILFGLSIGAVITITDNAGYADWSYYMTDFSYSIPGTIFFWMTIPTVVMVNSWVELFMRWRQSLVAKRIVITGSISLMCWFLAAGLWSPCTFPTEVSFDFCPYGPGPGWAWESFGDTLEPLPGVQYLVPYLVIVVAFVYILYIFFAACALHNKRRASNVRNTKDIDDPTLEQAERYKITSSLYTTPDTISEVGPSTIRSNVFSNRTTRPPSYGERSHAATSNRVSYGDAIYCKRCHEEVGFANPIHEEEEEYGEITAMHQEPASAHFRGGEK